MVLETGITFVLVLVQFYSCDERGLSLRYLRLKIMWPLHWLNFCLHYTHDAFWFGSTYCSWIQTKWHWWWGTSLNIRGRGGEEESSLFTKMFANLLINPKLKEVWTVDYKKSTCKIKLYNPSKCWLPQGIMDMIIFHPMVYDIPTCLTLKTSKKLICYDCHP